MAHLNEDGLRHLLELIKGKLGEVELASYLTHAMTTIVNKDPDGHAIFQGDKFGFESVYVEGSDEEPSVIIPFYNDPVQLDQTFTFYGDGGEEDNIYLILTNDNKWRFVSSLTGYKKGILEADILSSTGDSLTTVQTEFTINPIITKVGAEDTVNLNHPNVLAVRNWVAGAPEPCILLNSSEFIRTRDLTNESENLGSLSQVNIWSGEYITNIDGKFFNKCPLQSIVIYNNSKYSSSIDGYEYNLIFNTNSKEIIVGSCNADLSSLPDGQPWTLKEYAFCANPSLTQINIASNVIMKPNAFYDCIGLQYVYYDGSWDDFQFYACQGDPTARFYFSGDRPNITVYTNDGEYNI